MVLTYVLIVIGCLCMINLYDPNRYFIGWLTHRSLWKQIAATKKKQEPTNLDAIKSYFTPLMFCRHKSFPESIFGSGDGVMISGDGSFWNRNRIHASLIVMNGFHYRLGLIEFIKFTRWYKKNLASFMLFPDDEYYASARIAESVVERRNIELDSNV